MRIHDNPWLITGGVILAASCIEFCFSFGTFGGWLAKKAFRNAWCLLIISVAIIIFGMGT